MKKIFFKIGVACICLIILFGMTILGQIVYILNCSSKIGSRMTFDREECALMVNDDADIRILQISDTQITALGDSLKAFGSIKRTVEKARPDLIVLTGDNLMNDSTKGMLNRYINFFDEFEIPWAPVLGNHDYKTKMTMEEQCSLYEKGKFCLFKKGEVSDSYGNYYYNILRNGKPFHTLIFMDNAVRISEEQLDWYSNTINTISSRNDNNLLPNWTFFHIPLVETLYAYWQAVDSNSQIEGVRREGVAFLRDDVGFFNKALEIGSTKAIIYGHNHRNNYSVNYKGITLSFGTKTGKAAYHDEDLNGGNVYVLKSDNSFTIERIII